MAGNAGPLYHCDDVIHGWGCFHLDDANLTEEEQLKQSEPELHDFATDLMFEEIGPFHD